MQSTTVSKKSIKVPKEAKADTFRIFYDQIDKLKNI